MVELLFGCILFGEVQGTEKNTVKIVELYKVTQCATDDEADILGDKYLDDGGDSYLILTPDSNVKWSKEAKEKYELLKPQV